MTKEEAINRLKNMAWIYGSVEREQNIEAIDMAISALSEKTETLTHEEAWAEIEASDLISRADAIEAVQDVDTRESVNVSEAVKAINALPSANRPSGEWLPSNIPNEKWVCSECGGACWYYEHTMELGKSNYCPNCGARMKGGDDE